MGSEQKGKKPSFLFVCLFVLPCKEINRGAFGRFPFNKNSGLKLRKFQVPNGMVHSGCTHPTQATTCLVIVLVSRIQQLCQMEKDISVRPTEMTRPIKVDHLQSWSRIQWGRSIQQKFPGRGSKIYATATGLVSFLSQTEKMAGVLMRV